MYQGLKQAWEFHLLLGEKVKFPLFSAGERKAAISILRTLKSKSVKSFEDFGMTELSENLQNQRLKSQLTKEGLLVWLEDKPEKTVMEFEVIHESA
jgi:hypothetical protein